jgi:phage terminase small subunit
MAGAKGRSGRRPAPDLLVFAGDASTEFAKPDHLQGDASQFWDETYPDLQGTGRLRPCDLPMYVTCCELFGLYKIALRMAMNDPEDKTSHTRVTAYWAKFETAAKLFGLNPMDRIRLKGNKKGITAAQGSIEARKRG